MKIRILLLFIPFLFAPNGISAQKVVKIGDTEVVVQSPLKIKSDRNRTDSVIVKSDTITYSSGETVIIKTVSSNKYYNYKRKPRRHITQFYAGLGFATPIGSENALPIYYGNSFNLELGVRYLYRPAKAYAIGTFLQYSCYSYKLKPNGQDLFDLGIATTAGKHYYRTDNLGTGIINRFFLFPYSRSRQLYIDLGAYGDYSYSKRVKIKDESSGNKEKYKYRDGSKFNPFEAGVFAAIGYDWISVYGRYRLTNCFNQNEVDVYDPTRLSIGIQFSF